MRSWWGCERGFGGAMNPNPMPTARKPRSPTKHHNPTDPGGAIQASPMAAPTASTVKNTRRTRSRSEHRFVSSASAAARFAGGSISMAASLAQPEPCGSPTDVSCGSVFTMQLVANQPMGKQGRQQEPETTPEHDALIRDVAEDARREPERFLKDSVVPEGGE